MIATALYPLIVIFALIASVLVYVRFGYLTAVIFFPFPIGALGYVVARFLPLQVKSPG